MPTFGHEHFIRRAIDSLCAQSLTRWELIVVDDGSPDNTCAAVQPYLSDERISYVRLQSNQGLGAALNVGLDHTSADRVAYLPSDDLYYAEHLASLVAALEAEPGAVIAVSGIRHHYNRSSPERIDAYPLQLAQVIHRRTSERWTERVELVTDDLDRMYWSKLRRHGGAIATGRVTAEWVDHPDQWHKVIREPVGGVNTYRARYGVSHPLRFHSTRGNALDECEHYRRFRSRPDTPRAADGLKILLVGELAYNPERVLALEERGHTLHGLWMPEPYWYNSVGPVPFGHVTDVPRSNWRDHVRALQPDVIYAQLNWQAVPFVHRVLDENPGIPFVWHFKEGPFICLEKGTWPQLIDLYARSDGRIYCSPEMQDWFATAAPQLRDAGPSLVLDGDLPKAEWYAGAPSPLLSARDGELHTVVPGRPIGLTPERVGELAAVGVHLHFYGNFVQNEWKRWVERALALAPRHLHLHAHVDQGDWLREFSRYDAGWLHFFRSENGSELRRANWDDLNFPARMATFAAAGLPMLQANNEGAIVATQSLVRDLDVGLFFTDMGDLAAQLRDDARMRRVRENVWRHRAIFTFDHHADGLIAFFREVIAVSR